MAFQPRTAADLPPGAEVQTFWTTITKVSPDHWTNQADDTFTDSEINHLLSSGAMLTRVPTGRTKEQ